MTTRVDDRHERRIAQIENELTQLRASARIVMNAEELMALEHEIHEITNRPSYGCSLALEVGYYRRNCDRRKGKRHAGNYAGCVLLGIYERCTPALSSQVGMMAATLASFAETQQMLAEQGNELNIKTVRLLAYRAAERARMAQRMDEYGWQAQDTLAGRRVVVSTDGGRIRLREKKRGPKTGKGRTRYHGAWREPKLCVIYVVDEEGRQHQQFAPLIDGVLNSPDALFALLTSYLQELHIEEADQLLFISDGAIWIWNRYRPCSKPWASLPRRSIS